MKKIYFLLPLFCFSNMLIAQIPEPSVLFMEPKHGKGIDQIYSRVNKISKNEFIIQMTTGSQDGAFTSFCSGAKYKNVHSNYSTDGYTVNWERCYEFIPDSGYYYTFPQHDGTFVVGGGTGSSGPNLREFIIKKEDQSGTAIWGGKQYGGSAGEIMRDMIQVEDGGFIALLESNSNDGDVGLHYGSHFSIDLWAIKVDSNGDKVWTIVLGGSAEERASCIVPIPGGGCYILGFTLSTDHDCISNHGNSDVFIARLDSSGNKVWTKCLGGSGFDGTRLSAVALRAVPDGNGGALVAASTNSSDWDVTGLIGKGDFWLLDIDSAGNILWDNCFGGPTTDEFPQTICRATDGSIWIGGISTGMSGQVATHYGKTGSTDAWLVHADGNGSFLSAKVFGGPDEDELVMLHPLDNGLVMAGGRYRAAGGTVPDTFAGESDIFLARVAPWTTGVKGVPAINDKLVAYPNPASLSLNIRFESDDKVRQLVIFNASGKRVYKSNAIPDRELDVSDWPRGVYRIAIITSTNYHSTNLLIV